MSKRKRATLKKGGRVEQLRVATPPTTISNMAVAQENHLQWIEKWSVTLPRLYNVPVVQSLTYDLIQVLNDLHLRDVLEEGSPE